MFIFHFLGVCPGCVSSELRIFLSSLWAFVSDPVQTNTKKCLTGGSWCPRNWVELACCCHTQAAAGQASGEPQGSAGPICWQTPCSRASPAPAAAGPRLCVRITAWWNCPQSSHQEPKTSSHKKNREGNPQQAPDSTFTR